MGLGLGLGIGVGLGVRTRVRVRVSVAHQRDELVVREVLCLIEPLGGHIPEGCLGALLDLLGLVVVALVGALSLGAALHEDARHDLVRGRG